MATGRGRGRSVGEYQGASMAAAGARFMGATSEVDNGSRVHGSPEKRLGQSFSSSPIQFPGT